MFVLRPSSELLMCSALISVDFFSLRPHKQPPEAPSALCVCGKHGELSAVSLLLYAFMTLGVKVKKKKTQKTQNAVCCFLLAFFFSSAVSKRTSKKIRESICCLQQLLSKNTLFLLFFSWGGGVSESGVWTCASVCNSDAVCRRFVCNC